MSIHEELLNRYSQYGYWSANEFYLPIAMGLEFINDCNANEIAVLGVEFFHIEKGKIIPCDPLNSLDASGLVEGDLHWTDIVSETNKFASKVLGYEVSKDHTQYCNFQLLEESER